MAQDATIALSLEMDIIIDDMDFVLSSTLIPNSGFLMLGINSTKSLPLTAQQVFNFLMFGQSWTEYIPEPLAHALDQIAFQGFTATMFIGKDAKGNLDFRLSSVAVSIGSNPKEKIKLFGPFEAFTYRFIWTILNPTDEATRQVFVNFFAEIDFEIGGNKGVFDMEIITQ